MSDRQHQAPLLPCPTAQRDGTLGEAARRFGWDATRPLAGFARSGPLCQVDHPNLLQGGTYLWTPPRSSTKAGKITCLHRTGCCTASRLRCAAPDRYAAGAHRDSYAHGHARSDSHSRRGHGNAYRDASAHADPVDHHGYAHEHAAPQADPHRNPNAHPISDAYTDYHPNPYACADARCDRAGAGDRERGHGGRDRDAIGHTDSHLATAEHRNPSANPDACS